MMQDYVVLKVYFSFRTIDIVSTIADYKVESLKNSDL